MMRWGRIVSLHIVEIGWHLIWITLSIEIVLWCVGNKVWIWALKWLGLNIRIGTLKTLRVGVMVGCELID